MGGCGYGSGFGCGKGGTLSFYPFILSFLWAEVVTEMDTAVVI